MCSLGVPALQPEEKADAIAAIYDLLDRERAPATAPRVEQLIEALGRTARPDSDSESRERDPTR